MFSYVFIFFESLSFCAKDSDEYFFWVGLVVLSGWVASRCSLFLKASSGKLLALQIPNSTRFVMSLGCGVTYITNHVQYFSKNLVDAARRVDMT